MVEGCFLLSAHVVLDDHTSVGSQTCLKHATQLSCIQGRCKMYNKNNKLLCQNETKQTDIITGVALHFVDSQVAGDSRCDHSV